MYCHQPKKKHFQNYSLTYNHFQLINFIFLYLNTIFYVCIHCIWTYIICFCRKKLSKWLKLCAFSIRVVLFLYIYAHSLKILFTVTLYVKIIILIFLRGERGDRFLDPSPKIHACIWDNFYEGESGNLGPSRSEHADEIILYLFKAC